MPRPAGQHVAQVHHKSAIHGAAMHPPQLLGVQDLQAADAVLFQDRQEAVVRVLPNADLLVEVLDRPVVQQAVGGDGVRQMLVEVVGGIPQDPCHERQDALREREHGAGVLVHRLAEPRELLLLREARGLAEGLGDETALGPRPRRAVRVEGLLVVRPRPLLRRAALLEVHDLVQVLAAPPEVAPHGARVAQLQATLHRVRELEEAPVELRVPLQERLGDAVADDLHEADDGARIAQLLEYRVVVLAQVNDRDVLEGPRVDDLCLEAIGKANRVVGLHAGEHLLGDGALDVDHLLPIGGLDEVQLEPHLLRLLRVDDEVGVRRGLQAHLVPPDPAQQRLPVLRRHLRGGGLAAPLTGVGQPGAEAPRLVGATHRVDMALGALQQRAEGPAAGALGVLRREDALREDAEDVPPIGRV
mmetsp:Transcript_117709/g.329607  ORF Transcript_117709/g.329607 Transcript_117709/m.329607 type:complete len:416 (+) Transcript_117709:492-1739(+)